MMSKNTLSEPQPDSASYMFVVNGKYIEKYFPPSGFNGSTRRYGPLRGPTSSSCEGLRTLSEAFFGLRAKKERAYYAVLALYWRFLVSSSNPGKFK